MRTLHKLAAMAALPLVIGFAQEVAADPPHGKGKRDKDRGEYVAVPIVIVPPVAVQPAPVIVRQAPVAYRSGPPPWAPAHGYRRKQGQPAVYAAPFGIDVGKCYRETVGSVLGGVAGAALGSRIGEGSGKLAAVVGGTLLGVLVGGSVGRSLDRLDYACAGQALEHAPDNRTIVWNNPETGGSYRLTPTRAYQADGRFCREYVTTATVGGRSQQVYGTACRGPDGSWQIVG